MAGVTTPVDVAITLMYAAAFSEGQRLGSAVPPPELLGMDAGVIKPEQRHVAQKKIVW